MARGCIKYVIQEYIHPTGWIDRSDNFRDTDDGAQRRFDDHCKSHIGNFRLARLFVIDQRVMAA